MAKKRVTFTLDEKLIEDLKRVSKESMIPQARLVERAIKREIEDRNKRK